MDDAKGVLDLFKEYFEDEEIKKVWHNYSFDRAMMWRHGIDVKGFGGDTIHMYFSPLF
jgi:DNA polymerase-1